MHTTDPNQRMTFELKSWYQRIERSASNMKETSAYLKGLFRQALEGCDEADKALLLGDLDTYLEGRSNRFGSKSLVALSTGWRRSRTGPRSSGRRSLPPRTYGTALLTESGCCALGVWLHEKEVDAQRKQPGSVLPGESAHFPKAIPPPMWSGWSMWTRKPVFTR